MTEKRLAVFASGAGSNCKKILGYFQEKGGAEVSLILTNKPTAGVIQVAEEFGIPFRIIDRNEFFETDDIVDHLQELEIDLVILAGFLWKVPENLIAAFPEKILNLHPALLPKFGGKGMYGMHVHKAVIESGEQKSGITIHLVNQNYDEGRIIFQAECNVLSEDTPETLVAKIHALEHEHFPVVIEQVLKGELK